MRRTPHRTDPGMLVTYVAGIDYRVHIRVRSLATPLRVYCRSAELRMEHDADYVAVYENDRHDTEWRYIGVMTRRGWADGDGR